eukprot:12418649-Karenia_brevis.AAC.1
MLTKKIPAALNEKAREHRGVGIVFNKGVEKFVKQVTAHDGNNMTAHIEGPTTLIIHNTYQPHAGEQNIDQKRESTVKCKKSGRKRQGKTPATSWRGTLMPEYSGKT